MISANPGQNWAIYEANVQQYRVLSATVQSFLLTIGSILFTSGDAPCALLLLICLIGIAHVVWIWIPIVYARHRVVDYYKFQHDLCFTKRRREELESVCTETDYIRNAERRRRVNKDFFKRVDDRLWRPTRVKLDLIVPLTYVLLWLGLAIWKKPWMFLVPA